MKTSRPPIVTRKFPTSDNALNGDNGALETTASPRSRLKVVEVTFILDRPDAREVFLCGDFNQWAPESLRMIRRVGAGRWEKHLTLPPGRYEYRFVVDGQWMSDPQAPAGVPNPYGSFNSVVEVRR
jgi:1,4-alpha-glucan branching enzyme